MAFCQSCGTRNEDGVSFCKSCGNKIEVYEARIVCPSCRKVNPASVTYCWSCGAELVGGMPKAPAEPQPVAQPSAPKDSFPLSRKCPSCGQLVGIDAAVCTSCGRIFAAPAPMTPPGRRTPGSTWLNVAGILVILSGVAAFYTSYQMFLAEQIAPDVVGFEVESFGCCGILEIAFGVGAIVGGYFATARRRFLFALFGSIFGMMSIGPIYAGSIAAFIGLILIAVFKNEFED